MCHCNPTAISICAARQLGYSNIRYQLHRLRGRREEVNKDSPFEIARHRISCREIPGSTDAYRRMVLGHRRGDVLQRSQPAAFPRAIRPVQRSRQDRRRPHTRGFASSHRAAACHASGRWRIAANWREIGRAPAPMLRSKGSPDPMTTDYPLVDVIRRKPLEGFRLWVQFSDGREGVADLGEIVARGRSMVAPLKDAAFFSRAFIRPASPPGRTATTSAPPRCISKCEPRAHCIPPPQNESGWAGPST